MEKNRRFTNYVQNTAMSTNQLQLKAYGSWSIALTLQRQVHVHV